MNLRGQKVLVTGATGFIGGRLVEKLVLKEDAEAVPLVRKFKNACRLSRLPVKMIGGDILNTDSLRRAMDGCSHVVHCAIDGSGTDEQNRQVTVEGTRNVCAVAEQLGVKKLIHLSTISVYGQTAPGNLDEATPKKPQPDPYGTNKLEAERIALGFANRGVPITILQPTIVYGPWSHWTRSTAVLLGKGAVVLPDSGAGICNAVYVDDVVEAILCGLRSDSQAVGPYLISGAEPVTWAEYYQAYAKWIPGSVITGETFAALDSRLARQKFMASIAPTIFPQPIRFKISHFMQQGFPGIWESYNKSRGKGLSAELDIAKGAWPLITPNTAVHVFPMHDNVRLMALKSKVSIKKAQTELGYQPQYDLPKAMEQVGPWLQWAGFAPR